MNLGNHIHRSQTRELPVLSEQGILRTYTPESNTKVPSTKLVPLGMESETSLSAPMKPVRQRGHHYCPRTQVYSSYLDMGNSLTIPPRWSRYLSPWQHSTCFMFFVSYFNIILSIWLNYKKIIFGFLHCMYVRMWIHVCGIFSQPRSDSYLSVQAFWGALLKSFKELFELLMLELKIFIYF